METLKVSPNVEFEVIYADGEKMRVQEGILFGLDDEGGMILHNGTDEPAVWLAAAEILLEALFESGCLKVMAKGMLNHIPGPYAAASAFAGAVRLLSGSDGPAIFRLGQMDFQQCAADMLEDVAKKNEKATSYAYAFAKAAALVRDMKIPSSIEEDPIA